MSLCRPFSVLCMSNFLLSLKYTLLELREWETVWSLKNMDKISLCSPLPIAHLCLWAPWFLSTDSEVRKKPGAPTVWMRRGSRLFRVGTGANEVSQRCHRTPVGGRPEQTWCPRSDYWVLQREVVTFELLPPTLGVKMQYFLDYYNMIVILILLLN